jgi:Zn-dependent peptidase ImmA (M78 family)/DNA-binding XRE family transcriptional regulator
MPRSVRARINGALLTWAREEAGLDEAELGGLLKKSADEIRQWERGHALPTVRQARELAKKCDQPFAALYLPEAPKHKTQKLGDFRRLPEAMGNTLSRRLRLEIRRSSERREIEIELRDAMGESIPSLVIAEASSSSPPILATRLREVLGLSLETQQSWRNPRIAFNALRGLVSSHGVEVFQAKGIKVAEMRGFSMNLQPLPVIVVNRQDSYSGRSFTLVHELVHVIKNDPSLCDLDESAEHFGETLGEEIFCNAVAGNFLVPREDLLGQTVVASHGGVEWTDEAIAELAAQYSVSREVILRRLLDLGKTNRQFYEGKTREYAEELRRRPKRKGRLKPPVDALSLLGPSFVGLVMNAFSNEVITINDASDYLGLRVDHLDSLASSRRR